MIKFLKSKSSYKYLLPPGLHIVYDLVPFFKVADHIQKTKLSPEARKRLKWMDYYRKYQNVSQTCRHFDISRKTFYYWKKRYDPYNLSTLEDCSRRPKNTRQKEITPEEEFRVISLRKQYPVWGKLKLQRL